MTTTMTETAVETPPITEFKPNLDKGDTAHYVISPNPEETNHAYVMRARVEGFPVEALCGYTWVPFKNATALPVCSECEEISKNYPAGDGDPKE